MQYCLHGGRYWTVRVLERAPLLCMELNSDSVVAYRASALWKYKGRQKDIDKNPQKCN